MLDLHFYHRTDDLLDALTRLADPSRCGARLVVENHSRPIHARKVAIGKVDDPSRLRALSTSSSAEGSENITRN